MRNAWQPFASILLAILYVVAVVSPVIVAVLAVPKMDHAVLSEIAKNCGLDGIDILLMQFFLAARLPLVNRYSLAESPCSWS